MKQTEKTKFIKKLAGSVLTFWCICMLAAMALGALVMREVFTPDLAGTVLRGITLAAMFAACWFLAKQASGRRLFVSMAVMLSFAAAGFVVRIFAWAWEPFEWRWLAAIFITGAAAGICASRKTIRRR